MIDILHCVLKYLVPVTAVQYSEHQLIVCNRGLQDIVNEFTQQRAHPGVHYDMLYKLVAVVIAGFNVILEQTLNIVLHIAPVII